MLRRVATVFAVFAFFCGVTVLRARADSQVRIVRLSYADGTVQIDRGAGQGFEKALMNMPITQGARLETGYDGRAEVEFEDGSTIRLAPESKMNFGELGLRSSGDRLSLVELDKGIAYFQVHHKGHHDFRLLAAGQEVTLDHSAHFRAIVRGSEAKLAVFNGEVDIRQGGEKVKVKKDETAELTAAGPVLAKGIQPDPFDAWDKAREDYHDRYASNAYLNSPYQYGYSDLNYYGNYVYVPGYGQLWRPYVAGPGWNPYMDGAWAFYPSAGYVWVSNYPWGWMPYRYGTWVFVPAYGWCWQPGHRWNTWAAVPNYKGAPNAFTPPTPPAAPTAGTVIVNNGRPGPRVNPKMLPDVEGNPRNPRVGGAIAPTPTVPTPPPAATVPAAPVAPHPVPGKRVGREPDDKPLRSTPNVVRPTPSAPPAKVAPAMPMSQKAARDIDAPPPRSRKE